MCNPALIAVAGLALSAAGTAYQVSEQNSTVRAQNKFNQQAADEGAAAADAAFKEEAGQARLRDTQEAEAASNQKLANAKQAAAARETVRVSAGESGVSGVSVDNLVNDFYRQEDNYNSAVDRNLELGSAQTTEELKGLRAGAIDRTNSFKRAPIQAPSYLAAGVNFAGQAISSYRQYRYDERKLN